MIFIIRIPCIIIVKIIIGFNISIAIFTWYPCVSHVTQAMCIGVSLSRSGCGGRCGRSGCSGRSSRSSRSGRSGLGGDGFCFTLNTFHIRC